MGVTDKVVLKKGQQSSPVLKNIFSKILEQDNRNAVIAVVSSGQDARSLDYDMNQNYEDGDVENIGQDDRDVFNKLSDSVDVLYNALVPKSQQKVLLNSLRNGQAPLNDAENQIAKEIMIENILRTRCQAKIECEEKCTKSQEEEPKETRYCQKSCKAVFDYLMRCPPNSQKKKKPKKMVETNNCARDMICKPVP